MFANIVTALSATDAERGPTDVQPPKRAYAMPIVLIGTALTLPVLALLLSVLRGLTISNPLTREPLLGFSVDSAIGGIILAAEMVRRARKSIDLQYERFVTLDAAAQRGFRLRWLGVAVLIATALQLLASAIIWK